MGSTIEKSKDNSHEICVSKSHGFHDYEYTRKGKG